MLLQIRYIRNRWYRLAGTQMLQASLTDDTTTINQTTNPSTFDILTRLFERPNSVDNFAVFRHRPHTNLATHKPTHEKIKTPHRTKKLNLPAAHFAHLVLPSTQANPWQNQKSKIFPPHHDRLVLLFYICPL